MTPIEIKKLLREISASQTILAVVADVPVSDLSVYLNSGRLLKHKADHIANCARSLRQFVHAIPVPIDFSRTLEVKDALQKFENGQLEIHT